MPGGKSFYRHIFKALLKGTRTEHGCQISKTEGVVNNYGEAGGYKTGGGGGASAGLPLRKGGGRKSSSHAGGGAQRVLG